MIAVSKITKKHQTTIPMEVIKALKAAPGNELVYIVEEDKVILQARTGRLVDLAGTFSHFGKKPAKPLTLDELDEAAARAWSGEEGGTAE